MDIENYSRAAMVWALRKHGEVGPRTFRMLIARFGQLEKIFDAEIDELQEIEGLGEKRSERIYNVYNYLEEAEHFVTILRDRKVSYAVSLDDEYPLLFEELNDPPPFLFYRGELPKHDEKRVAIVGSHKASTEGITLTVELAKQLAEKGVSIVSGLAQGIDTSAHIGALKGKGRTYALIGSGLDNVYPEENVSLAQEIIANGAVISEYQPDSQVSPGKLVARNRLIVGLSQAVIIGEITPESSGTLDTATFCHEIGKIMFIVLDYYEKGVENPAAQKVLALGAIPIWIEKDLDMVINSLV